MGCIEAPRGTLIHDYYINENLQLTKVNLIVSTGHNNYAMSKAVDSVAKTYVHGPVAQRAWLNRVEHAIALTTPA